MNLRFNALVITLREAQEQGLRHYFTGKACKRGHVVDRLVSNRSCTACSPILLRSTRKRNPERTAQQRRRSYVLYADTHQRCRDRWAANNSEKLLEIKRVYRKRRADLFNHYCARRRAAKRKAIPGWTTKEMSEQIASFYKQAKRLTNQTGINHHVDHIIPLRGKFVCGLHVPWNLQILTEADNLRKKNKILEPA